MRLKRLSNLGLYFVFQKQSLNDISLFKDYTTLLRTRSKTSQSLTAGSDKQPQQKQLSVEEVCILLI